MKLFEFFFWLLYACLGFLHFTWLGCFGFGLKAIDAHDPVAMLGVELLVFTSIGLFCSTLLWCMDSTNPLKRLRLLKLTACLLVLFGSVLVCTLLRMFPERFYEMLLLTPVLFGPLLLAMAFCLARSRTRNADQFAHASAWLVYQNIFVLLILLIMVVMWNIIFFFFFMRR